MLEMLNVLSGTYVTADVAEQATAHTAPGSKPRLLIAREIVVAVCPGKVASMREFDTALSIVDFAAEVFEEVETWHANGKQTGRSDRWALMEKVMITGGRRRGSTLSKLKFLCSQQERRVLQ